MTLWEVLGIAPTGDRGEIRRAYAARLKATNPEDDPEGFKALRQAYESALNGTFYRPLPAPPTPPAAPKPPLDSPETAPETPVFALDPRQEHANLQSELDRALRRRNADPDAILAAYKAVMTSPAMGQVDVEAATEDWLAGLIASRAPRSDPLIPLALARFNWSNNSVRRRDNYQVQQVLRRERDLAFLRELRTDSTPHHKAWLILSQPFQPITIIWRLVSPTTPSMIRDLIDIIRAQHPTLMHDVNRDTVTRWEAWQDEKPRLRSWGVRTVAFAPVCLLLLLLGQIYLPSDSRALTILLIIPPAFAAVALFNTVLLENSRRLLNRRNRGAPAWLRDGWMPLLLATIGLAAFPELPFGAWTIGVLAAVSFVWAAATAGEIEGTALSRAASSLHMVVWLIVSSFALPAPALHAMQFTIAAGAGAVIPVFGQAALRQLWHSLSRDTQLAQMAAAMMCSLCALGLLVLAFDDEAWNQPAACATLAALVVHRALATGFSGVVWRSSRLTWGSLAVMVITALNGYPGLVLLVGGGIWLVWQLVLQVRMFIAGMRSPDRRG